MEIGEAIIVTRDLIQPVLISQEEHPNLEGRIGTITNVVMPGLYDVQLKSLEMTVAIEGDFELPFNLWGKAVEEIPEGYVMTKKEYTNANGMYVDTKAEATHMYLIYKHVDTGARMIKVHLV